MIPGLPGSRSVPEVVTISRSGCQLIEKDRVIGGFLAVLADGFFGVLMAFLAFLGCQQMAFLVRS